MMAVALVAALLLIPSGNAAGEDQRASSAGTDDCWNPSLVQVPRCHLFTNASVNLTACDDATCTLAIQSGAYGVAGPLPGVLNVATTMTVSTGGAATICLGPEVLTDPTQDLLPCDRLCHATMIGRSASCEGERIQVVPLAEGRCVTIVIASDLMYDPYNGFAAFAMFFKACREEDGSAYVYALPT